MDDFKINVLSGNGATDSGFICLEFDNLPRILSNFFISKKQKLSNSENDYDLVKFIYADDKQGIIDLSCHIEEYMDSLTGKDINQLILKGYLEEIYGLLKSLNLIKKDKILKKM